MSDFFSDVESHRPQVSNPATNIALPNYRENCSNCGQTPTVDIANEKGKTVLRTGMCGVCTWGEAECLDPDNWEETFNE